MDKVILDGVTGEGGVLPYLPLDRLGGRAPAQAPAQAPATGGTN
jgi:hypothetical protein